MVENKMDYLEFINVPEVDEKLWKAGYFCGECTEKGGILSKPLSDLGFTQEDMLTGKYRKHIHPHDKETYQALWNRVQIGQDDEIDCEYRIQDKQKKWNWIETHGVVIEKDKENRGYKIVGMDRNITSRKYAESYIRRELMDTKRKFDLSESIRLIGTHLIPHRDLLENHESGLEQLRQIVEFDHCQIYSYSERNRDSTVKIIISYPSGKTPKTNCESLLEELVDKYYPVIIDDQKICTPYFSLLAIPLRFSGRFMGAVLLWHEKEGFYRGKNLHPVRAFADIMAVAVRNSRDFTETRYDTELDQLTGFLTRRSFQSTAEDLWKSMQKGGSSAAVAMINIDSFKLVNENYGRAVGDRVMGKFSDLCRMKLRSDALLGRYGREEFVVVLPECGELDYQPIFERVRSSCESTIYDGVEGAVTISIGVTISTGREEPEVVIDRASKALYKAKAEGRNRIVALHHS